MRVFVMGDIHGACKALKQCLHRSSFDYENDLLIQLGDVADGYDEVYECVNELLKLRNLISIKGNHDDWFSEYINTGLHPDQWKQGGAGTMKSYLRAINKEEGNIVSLNPADIPGTHQSFFREQHLYFIDENNNCFVHAGFDRNVPFKGQHPEEYFWNRHLWLSALSFKAGQGNPAENNMFKMATDFHEIFIGHTSTTNWKTDQPMHVANIWNLDTGAGHDGKLTIMEVETKQFWQSDSVMELYNMFCFHNV
jgi:serine/threonine protein phosphatase 1